MEGENAEPAGPGSGGRDAGSQEAAPGGSPSQPVVKEEGKGPGEAAGEGAFLTAPALASAAAAPSAGPSSGSAPASAQQAAAAGAQPLGQPSGALAHVQQQQQQWPGPPASHREAAAHTPGHAPAQPAGAKQRSGVQKVRHSPVFVVACICRTPSGMLTRSTRFAEVRRVRSHGHADVADTPCAWCGGLWTLWLVLSWG